MKQDRAALEDRDVSIGQPRHLAEGLVREMLGIPSAKWHALDAIGQPGLFQCPTHTYITQIAPRRLGCGSTTNDRPKSYVSPLAGPVHHSAHWPAGCFHTEVAGASTKTSCNGVKCFASE